VAYILRRSGDPLFVDLGKEDDINSDISRFRTALSNPRSQDVTRSARRLDEKLMRPLRKLLGNTRRIFLSPDGALNLIPFAALVDEQNRFLVEDYSITYLTSGRDLLRLRGSAVNVQPPLIVADPAYDLNLPKEPKADKTESGINSRSGDFSNIRFNSLPGTKSEAMGIGTILGNARIVMGAQATEAAIKQAARPSVFHIATHGFFLPDQGQTGASANRSENPLLRSGLVLAGVNQRQSGSGEDGVLTALEASGLDLWNTKLVVLSACETGIGDVRNGEGVYGLRRALVLAGAESQVMSLWQVSDAATRDLMVEYYRGLKAGQGRTEALRDVQLSMLRSKTRAHPFYWASFIQTGAWTRMTF
jgi:CHAT domain-containing protein